MCRLVFVVWLLACGSSPRPAPQPASPLPGGTTAPPDQTFVPIELEAVESTLKTIDESYVDAKRLDLRRMFVGALEAMQESMAEVLIEDHADRQEVTVRVNQQREAFPTSDLDSSSRLATRLTDVFRFVRAHKNPGSDLTKVEYEAVNGLLHTLDPHSNLLDPEAAKEMEIQISGKFGGIGVQIGTHKTTAGEARVIVRDLIDGDTPARRAGIKANDVIVKIDGAPTDNLTLEEASNRLRGDPGTNVSLLVEREGARPQTIDITRSQIRMSAVKSRLIGKVGYIVIDSFSTDVALDTGRAMDELLRKGARSWVLDLRQNNGGLLGEAVKIADRFVERGTIVTTVSPQKRRVQAAGASDTDDKFPLAVLVGNDTASSAEILAGALKYLDRAVIVGTTTWGKGSVQVLFDNDDGSRLKLTIAQYLTARDLSIQGVGIAPDLQLERLSVPEKLASWQDIIHLVPPPRFAEIDLDKHLTHTGTATDKPAESLYYLGASSGDPELDFAVELMSQTRATRRRDVVTASKSLVAKVRKREEQKLVAALGKLGIDWTAGPAASTQLVASFVADRPRITAGDVVKITGTVKNTGTKPAFRVRARARTDDEAIDGAELVFGRIEPGATKTATVQLQTVKSAPSRAHSIQWVFDDVNAPHTTASPQRLATEGLPHPRFAYTYQVVDGSDGLVQPGEKLRVRLRVKNVGAGRGLATVASLTSMAGDRVVVNKGRFELPGFEPGQTRDVEFTIEVRTKLDLAKLPLELVVYDSELREGATEKFELAVNEPIAITAGTGAVQAAAATLVHAAAAIDAEVLGSARPGAILRVTGRSSNGKWVRVELEPGLPGFVAASAVTATTAAPDRADRFARRWQSTPPALAVTGAVTQTTSARIELAGTATDEQQVDDVYVTVSNAGAKIERRKVFYLSNRGSKTPGRLEFKSSIPLWPGSNRVTIIARESEKVKATQALWIYRAP